MKLTTALHTIDDSSEGGYNDDSSDNDLVMGHDDAVTDITHNSFHSNSSGSNPLSCDESHRALREIKEIADQETRRMRCWRFIILLSILLTGASVCTTVYLFLTDKQESDFDSQVRKFVSNIRKILKSLFHAYRPAGLYFSFTCIRIRLQKRLRINLKLPNMPLPRFRQKLRLIIK